jgi:preprotein translocase subunit SecY
MKNFSTKFQEKFFLTLFLLALYRFGSEIPLTGIDQQILKANLLQTNSSLLQTISMYSNGGENSLSSFSLGIIPFINASIVVDLGTTIVPFLEKLQSEEGDAGKKQLFFYKKALSLLFAIFQSIFLIFYLKPYFYDRSFASFFSSGLELTTGSLIVIWISTIIDTKGLGNGSSLIILVNILVTTIRNFVTNFEFPKVISLSFGLEILFFIALLFLVINSQVVRYSINIVSARQLTLLQTKDFQADQNKPFVEKLSLVKDTGLAIKYMQAGIFPVIIASNIFPFLSLFSLNLLHQSKIGETIIYYLLIIIFNYFYTVLFWDPEKISQQLRKSSVSIIGKNPGKQTTEYLKSIAFYTSIVGGLYLCSIFALVEILKQFSTSTLVNQFNVSSLIIGIGILCETVRNINSLLMIERIKNYESTSIS